MGFGTTTKTAANTQNFHDLTAENIPGATNYRELLQREHEKNFQSTNSKPVLSTPEEYQIKDPGQGFVSKMTLSPEGVVTFRFNGSNYGDQDGRLSIQLKPSEGLNQRHIDTLKSIVDRGANECQSGQFSSADTQINELLYTLGYINGEPTTQDLSGIRLQNLAIRGLKGGHYIMDNAKLNQVLLEQSDLKGSSHLGANWKGVGIRGNDLGGADLSGAQADKDSFFENNCINDTKLNMKFSGQGFRGNVGLNAQFPPSVTSDLKSLLKKLEEGGNRNALKNAILERYNGLTFEKEGEFVEIAKLLKKYKLLVKPKQMHEERGWDSFKKQMEQDGLHVFKEKIGGDEIFKVVMPNGDALAFKKGPQDSLQFVKEHSTADLGSEFDLEKVRLSKLWGAIMQRQRESQVFTIADAEEETTASETANSPKVKKEDETVENPQKNDTSPPQSLQQKVENATGVIDVLPTEIKEEWYSMHFAGAGLPESDKEE